MLQTSTVATGRPAPSLATRRWHARLDLMQSATGFALAAFLLLHTLFVSTLLFSPDAFAAVLRLTDLTVFFGHPVQVFHVLVAGLVATFLLVHAVTALRKFPAGYREYQDLHRHLRGMRHVDSTLWFWQGVTGLLLFFLASVHLYAMITQPDRMSPEFAVTRIVDERAWLLYLLLTPIAQFHSLTGLYRLALKWGIVRGRDPRRTRRRLLQAVWVAMAAFVAIGFATLTKELRAGLTRARDAVAVMP